ncbi:MAG: hypothetical protein AUG49_25380 [Catenulispora sp. 13_1_20CM_3_70_7]|nr:MAG: hypothetical protein AUG49_25380 [Catenulispora sp. 13_1_20CM_3_70_7]
MSEVAGVVFANGPVQNGEFTLAERPGKVAGIRIAAAMNQLLGAEPTPQLWNTVTLAGDLRHRALQENSAAHRPPIHGVWAAYGQVERGVFERQLVAAKYPVGAVPHVWTDVDEPVVATALAMVEHGLAVGDLVVETIEVRLCASCGHLAGLADRPCRACGHQVTRSERARHLLARRRPGAELVDAGDFHAHARRAPAHLLSLAANAPEVLLLSRTRDHGIGLEPLGLPGLVLDPRAGLHAAVLAVAAERGGPELVVMTTTENAAANIAAYGACFRAHLGIRLRYGLHGRIPYEQVGTLDPLYRALDMDAAARERFEDWFLPLASWHHKNNIDSGQLPALLRLFHRARSAPGAVASDELATLRAQIIAGDTRWLTDKRLLAAAVRGSAE